MKKERFAKDWLFLYSVALVFAAGTFLAQFFYIYSITDIAIQKQLIVRYCESLLYTAGFCTLIITPIAILYQNNQKKYEFPIWQFKLRYNFYGFFILLILLYGIYLLYKFDLSIKIIDFLAAVLAVYLVYSFQAKLVVYGCPAWKHPTTTTNIIAGVVKAGVVVLILLMNVQNIAWFILAVLIFEILVIFARFKFLNSYSLESRQTSRLLLTRYNILFGARMIVGLFIPLVYAGYSLIGQIQSLRFIAIFLALGELIERYLFVYAAAPEGSK